MTAGGPRSVAARDISGLVITGDVFLGGFERLEDLRQYADRPTLRTKVPTLYRFKNAVTSHDLRISARRLRCPVVLVDDTSAVPELAE